MHLKTNICIIVNNILNFLPHCNPFPWLWQILNERSTKELEQMQVKNGKLQQECEQLSSVKEHFSLENQQIANELKVHV